MSLYKPTAKLKQILGSNWDLKTTCLVDTNEGLSLTSNVVSGLLRTVIYDVVSPGPGGTIGELEHLVRQTGEERVKVVIKKNGDEKGEDVVSYD